jgi:S1-C subfamily serine protease
MTNAHVVAGTKTVQVVQKGNKINARVVEYDSDLDLAVIYAPGLTAPGDAFRDAGGSEQRRRDRARIPAGRSVQRAGGTLSATSVTSPGRISTSTRRSRARSTRSKGLVRSGNSGGPLIDPDGTVLGVIFAAAADNNYVGYAVTASQAAQVAADGRSADGLSGHWRVALSFGTMGASPHPCHNS